MVGLLCARRSGSFYGGVAGALACATVLAPFALDRPYLVTFLFLALTLAAMETRRWMWALPAVFAVWANCHGGYFLGFVVLGAYCAESLWQRRRDATLWAVTAACVAASAINPNGFGIFRTLLDYRSSYMQGRLLEWARPAVWPPAPFSVLLLAAGVLAGAGTAQSTAGGLAPVRRLYHRRVQRAAQHRVCRDRGAVVDRRSVAVAPAAARSGTNVGTCGPAGSDRRAADRRRLLPISRRGVEVPVGCGRFSESA